MESRAAPLVLATLAAVLAAACSSTSGQRTSAGKAGASASPEAIGATEAVPADASSDSTRPRSAAARKNVANARGGQAGSTAGGSVPAAAGGTIKIGLHYSENLDAAYAAFGATRPNVDMPAAIRALVDHVNKTGGLGGRKVEAVIHGTDPLQGTFASQAEVACRRFTEDAKVFAVVSGAVTPDLNMPECHYVRQVPLVWEYHFLMDRSSFDKYGQFLYMPPVIAADRLGIYVDELVAAGFFTAGAKIGLLRYDTPIHKRFLDNVLKPRLAAHQLTIAEDVAVRQPPSASAASDTAAELSNAVIRFRNANVTHLLFVPTGGAVPFLYGNIAEGQSYRTRWGLNSLEIPNFVATNTPVAQLRGAFAVGWLPAGDLANSELPRDYPELERCFQAAGVRVSDVVRFCDGLFFLQSAFARGAQTTAGGLRGGIYELAESYRSPWTYRTKFAGGRHDGAAAIRMLSFVDDCRCFRYTGSLKGI